MSLRASYRRGPRRMVGGIAGKKRRQSAKRKDVIGRKAFDARNASHVDADRTHACRSFSLHRKILYTIGCALLNACATITPPTFITGVSTAHGSCRLHAA